MYSNCHMVKSLKTSRRFFFWVYFFFYLMLTNHRAAGEGKAPFLTPLFQVHHIQEHLDIGQEFSAHTVRAHLCT